MTGGDLFTPQQLGRIQQFSAWLSELTPEQREAVEVALFSPPDLPGHLKESEALLAWQVRVSEVRQRMTAKGWAEEAEVIIARHGFLETVAECREAYEELKAEGLRLSGGHPTTDQLERVSGMLDYYGLKTPHDRASFIAYMLNLSKPTLAQHLSAVQCLDFVRDTENLMQDERAACVLESRRLFGVRVRG